MSQSIFIAYQDDLGNCIQEELHPDGTSKFIIVHPDNFSLSLVVTCDSKGNILEPESHAYVGKTTQELLAGYQVLFE